MFHLLKNLFRRPPIRMGLSRDRGGRLRDPRFVSFMSQSNRRKLDHNFHDTVMRGRRLVRHALVLAVVAGFAWIVIESAKALSVF